MTREALAITPSYPINGVGPYQYNNPYVQGALRAFVELDERLIALATDEYVADPLSSNTSGSIALTTPTATAYDGGTLYLLRQTDIEQGFAGQSARENGLAAQLDWMTEAIQDTAREVRRSLRSTVPLEPGIVKAGRTLLFDDDLNLIPGPTTGEIENASENAQTSLNAAAAAAKSAAEAALFKGPWIDSVEDLKIDTSLSYAIGQPGTIAVGDIVRTRKEGFSYKIAPLGVAKPHVTTANNVLLYVQKGDRGFNIRAFGATGSGSNGEPGIDTKPFELAAEWLASQGGGTVYVPSVDVEAGEYYSTDYPIDLRPYVWFEGDGPSSLIFNIRPTGVGLFGDHAVFNPGNYHPAYYNDLPFETLNDVAAGDRTVKLAAESFTAGDFPKNSTVVLRGGDFFASAFFDVYEWQRLNRIVSSDPATGEIVLMYAIDEDIIAPEISLADDQVNSGRIGYSDGTSRKCFVAYKSGLRNLGIRSNSLWVADSATLDCLFENLWLDARRGLYGNSFCHSEFRNIHAKVKENALEWSCNSHDSNINGYFVDSDFAFPTVVAFAVFGENASNCHMKNFSFKADNWDSTNVMLRFAFTKNCSMTDGTVFAQTHRGVGIQFESTTNDTPCSFNKVKGVDFIGGSIGSSCVSFGNTGFVKYNGVEECNWIGEGSARHGYVRGEGNYLRRNKFSKADSRLDITSTSAFDCEIVDNSLTAGFTLIDGSEFRRHKIADNQTLASRAARAVSVRTFTRDSVAATAAGTVYKSAVFPANSLTGGDRVRVLLRGRVSSGGTTAAKEIRLVDDSGTYASITFAAEIPEIPGGEGEPPVQEYVPGESGTFVIDATLLIDSTSTIVGYADIKKDGASSTTRTAVTGLNLSANSRTMAVQGWTGDAGETILFDQTEIWVEKIGQFCRPV